MDELATAIRKVHSGGRYLDAEMAASAMMAGESPLTERERGALALAAQGAPVGEIAASLHLTEGTVRNYLSSAITKTGRHQPDQRDPCGPGKGVALNGIFSSSSGKGNSWP